MEKLRVFLDPVGAVLVISIASSFVGLALSRDDQAPPNRTERIVGARTRRAYLCFLVWGVFLIVFCLTTLLSSKGSFTTQQGLAALVGIFLGIPASLVFLVGLIQALMVWRVRWIRFLLLASVVLSVPFIFQDVFPDQLATIILVAYSIFVTAASLWGLRALRRSPAPGVEHERYDASTDIDPP